MSDIGDPFVAGGEDFDTSTPPLDEIIKEAIEVAATNLHVWMPAVVVAVKGPGKVSLQPQLMRKFTDGTVMPLPVIQNAMVAVLRGGDYAIDIPVAVGDTGMAMFCDRSLDKWSVSGGTVDPEDTRKHDLTDAIFVPGLYPFSQPPKTLTTDLVVTNGLAKMSLQKPGTFKFNGSTSELMSVLSQITQQLTTLTQTLSTDTVNTIFGPMPLNSFAVYATINVQLNLLLVQLNSLKGV